MSSRRLSTLRKCAGVEDWHRIATILLQNMFNKFQIGGQDKLTISKSESSCCFLDTHINTRTHTHISKSYLDVAILATSSSSSSIRNAERAALTRSCWAPLSDERSWFALCTIQDF
jgi:hypothetical protein